MSEKLVSIRLEDVPPLTGADRKRLAELDALPDDEIDVSDIREMTDEEFANAVRYRDFRPIKKQITARLDADVLAWLKSGGKGYQTRMNAILRKAMLEAK